MGHWEASASAFVEWPLGYHPCDIGILTCAHESGRGTLLGGQFDWGGRLLKCSGGVQRLADRKSTRLNSSHVSISYAVFCLKKKKKIILSTIIDSESHRTHL